MVASNSAGRGEPGSGPRWTMPINPRIMAGYLGGTDVGSTRSISVNRQYGGNLLAALTHGVIEVRAVGRDRVGHRCGGRPVLG